jgi:hypothetical protein
LFSKCKYGIYNSICKFTCRGWKQSNQFFISISPDLFNRFLFNMATNMTNTSVPKLFLYVHVLQHWSVSFQEFATFNITTSPQYLKWFTALCLNDKEICMTMPDGNLTQIPIWMHLDVHHMVIRPGVRSAKETQAN